MKMIVNGEGVNASPCTYTSHIKNTHVLCGTSKTYGTKKNGPSKFVEDTL